MKEIIDETNIAIYKIEKMLKKYTLDKAIEKVFEDINSIKKPNIYYQVKNHYYKNPI